MEFGSCSSTELGGVIQVFTLKEQFSGPRERHSWVLKLSFLNNLYRFPRQEKVQTFYFLPSFLKHSKEKERREMFPLTVNWEK